MRAIPFVTAESFSISLVKCVRRPLASHTPARHPATRRHASLARSCPRPSRRRSRSRDFRRDFSGVTARVSHDGDVAPDDFHPAAFGAPSRARGDGRAAAALGRVRAGGWRRYRGCGHRDRVDEPRPGRSERRGGGASPIKHRGRRDGHGAARSRSRRGAIEPRRAPRVPGVRHQTQGRGPYVLPQPRAGRTVPRGDAKVRALHAPRTPAQKGTSSDETPRRFFQSRFRRSNATPSTNHAEAASFQTSLSKRAQRSPPTQTRFAFAESCLSSRTKPSSRRTTRSPA